MPRPSIRRVHAISAGEQLHRILVIVGGFSVAAVYSDEVMAGCCRQAAWTPLQLPAYGDWPGIKVDVIPAQTERFASLWAMESERTMIPRHLLIAVTNIAGYVHIG
jgi:hypothetical protein